MLGFHNLKALFSLGWSEGNTTSCFSLTLFSKPKNTIGEVRSPSRATVWAYRPWPACRSLWWFYCLPMGCCHGHPLLWKSHLLLKIESLSCSDECNKMLFWCDSKVQEPEGKSKQLQMPLLFFFFSLRNLQPKEPHGSLMHGFYNSEVGHTVSHAWAVMAFTFPEEKYSCWVCMLRQQGSGQSHMQWKAGCPVGTDGCSEQWEHSGLHLASGLETCSGNGDTPLANCPFFL